MADRPFEEFKHEEVLWSGKEDQCMLAEAWWGANTWYPDWPISARLAYAERAIRELVDEGLIVVCRGTWEDAEQHPVPEAELDAVLKSFRSWVIPAEGPEVFYYAK